MEQPLKTTSTIQPKKIIVDTRPLGLVILSRSSRLFAFAFIGFLFWLINSWPTPAGLTIQGQKALAIFVAALLLWITQLLPLAITSLLALVALPLTGVMDKTKAYALFGNEAVFFIMGAFILTAALVKNGVAKRLALFFLVRFKQSPKRLILGVLLIPAFLSLWMSEHAVAAIMFPIILEVVRSLDLRPGSRFAKAIFLTAAYGAIIGGVTTFLGGARNPLAVAILKQTTGQTVGFFEWMQFSLPIVIILLFVAYFLVLAFINWSEVRDIKQAVANMEKAYKSLGRLTLEEKLTGLIMLAAIFFWIIAGQNFGLANIAVIAVVALFAFNLVTWKDIEDYVNWGVILMYGGAIALGAAVNSTKAALWVAKSTVLSLTLSPVVLALILVVVSILLTEAISNAAVVAILMPIGITLANSYHLDPKLITLMIAIPSGLAYMLPMGTPANAIAYSSGYLKISDMVRLGVILMVVSIIVFLTVAKTVWPFLGLGF